MDTNPTTIDTFTKLAFQFGPFFFAVLFFFLLNFAASKLQTSDKDSRPLYRKLSVLAWCAMLALVGISVYFWYLINIVDRPDKFIAGQVSDFKEPEQMLSTKMYIREDNYNRSAQEFDYQWLVKEEDIQAPEELKIAIFPDKTNQKDYHIPLTIPVKRNLVGAFVKLKWDRANGILRDENNNPVGLETAGNDNPISLNVLDLITSSAHASDLKTKYALEDSSIICSGQKVISDACIKLVQRQIGDAGHLSFDEYHFRRQLIETLLLQDEVTLGKVFASSDQLRKGDVSVSNDGATKAALFTQALTAEGILKDRSVLLAQKLDAKGYELYLKRQLVDNRPAQRMAAANTILNTRNTQLLGDLRINQTNETNAQVRQNLSQAITLLDEDVLAQRIGLITDQKIKTVLMDLFDLYRSGASYKFGGQHAGEGFDAKNLVAYLLDKNDIQKRNVNSAVTAFELDASMKKLSEDEPHQAGDLVFYNYGQVMFYLWDDQVMGMTPSGIKISPLVKFGAPLRFSRFGTTQLAESQCLIPPLSCETANVMIREYYDKNGEWAGVFQISTITDTAFESIAENSVIARVKYLYKPAAGSFEKRTGSDNRIFDFTRVNGKWSITRMRGYLSGAPIPALDLGTSKAKLKEFIEDKSPFAGLVMVDRLIEVNLKNIDQTSIEAFVNYAYRPAPHFEEFVQAGERKQTFRIEFFNNNWEVVAIVTR